MLLCASILRPWDFPENFGGKEKNTGSGLWAHGGAHTVLNCGWHLLLLLPVLCLSQEKGREMSSFALLCSVEEQLPLCCLTSHRDQLSALNPWHRSHHLFFSHLYKLIGGLPCSAISCPSLPPRSWLILGTCRLGCTEQPDQQPCRALHCVAATCAQSLCTDPSPARSPCLCTL